jgi:hypothetical protein
MNFVRVALFLYICHFKTSKNSKIHVPIQKNHIPHLKNYILEILKRRKIRFHNRKKLDY